MSVATLHRIVSSGERQPTSLRLPFIRTQADIQGSSRRTALGTLLQAIGFIIRLSSLPECQMMASQRLA